MKRLRRLVPVPGIFGFALLVRVVYNLTVGRGYVPGYDSSAYQSLGFHILEEHCFCINAYQPTVGRAPLWPGIIAIVTYIAGHHNLYSRLFLSFIGSGTCVLVYLFARDIFGRRIALLAGIVAATYTGLFIYDGWLYSESLYTFLLLACAYSVHLIQRTSQARWMVVGGVLLGLLSLTRPNGLIVLALFTCWALIVGWVKIVPWKVVARSVAIVTLLSLAIVAPWTIRNYVETHTFLPVATGDGIVLEGAYNDLIFDNVSWRGRWVGPGHLGPQRMLSHRFPHCDVKIACTPAWDAALRNEAWQWMRSHISVMPHLLGLHMKNMWTPSTPEADLPMNQFPERTSSKIVLHMIPAMSYIIFVLAALGLLVTLRIKWRQLLFIYLMILLDIAQCLYFYGSSRFRAPIEPMLVLLAIGFTWWLSLLARATSELLLRQGQRPGAPCNRG